MKARLWLRIRSVIGAITIFALVSSCIAAQIDTDRELARILQDWRDGLKDPPPGVMEKIANLGADATPLVSRLIHLLRSSEPGVRAQSSRILTGLGVAARPAIPALLSLIRDSDPLVRQSAAYALSNQPNLPESSIPILSEAFRVDPGPGRPALFYALLAVGGSAQPVIAELLSDPKPVIRSSLVQYLARFPWTNRFGRPTFTARSLESHLDRLSKDSDLGVRLAVADLVGASRPYESSPFWASFRNLSVDPNQRIRAAFVKSMARRRTIPVFIRSDYLKLMEDLDPKVRTEALTWIPYQDLSVRAFVDVLLVKLADPVAEVRAAAIGKLSQAHLKQQFWNPEGKLSLQTRTSEALARHGSAFLVLKAASADSEPILRAGALGLLPVWKENAETVIPLLMNGLRDPDANVRAQAASGLVTFGPEAKIATRALLACLADPGAKDNSATMIAMAAAQALEAIGGSAREKMIWILLAQLNSLDASVVNRSLATLQSLAYRLDRELLQKFADPRTNRHVRMELSKVIFGVAIQRPGADSRHLLPVLRNIVRDPDLETYQLTLQLLTHIDPQAPEAVAIFFASLRDGHDQQQINQWIHSILKPEMISQLAAGLDDESSDIRIATANALALLANQVSAVNHRNPAVGTQAIQTQVADQERRKNLAAQLVRILIPALKDQDKRVSWIATYALGVLESEHEIVIPILLEMAKSKTRVVPDGNMISIRQFGDRGQSYYLGPNPRKEGDSLQVVAMQSLGAFGPAAASSVRELIHAIHDPDPRVQWFAIESLALIGPPAKEAVPILIEALHSTVVADSGLPVGNGAIILNENNNGPIRLIAAEALGRIGPDAKSAIPELIKALSGPDSRVRSEAARALGAIGPAAAAAIPELVRVSSRTPANSASLWSQTALVQIGKAAVPALAEALRNPDQEVRLASIQTLGRFGTKGEEAVLPLLGALKDDEPRIREAAVQALGEIGSEKTSVTTALIGTLNDPEDDVAGAAGEGLVKVGYPAVPALLALSREDDLIGHRMAVSILTVMAMAQHSLPNGTQVDTGRNIRKALCTSLGDKDERTRLSASEALQQVGEPAVPELIAALDDPSSTIRAGVAVTLGALSHAARKAIDPLHRHQNDPDSAVRRAVENAIQSIEQSESFEVRTLAADH